MNSHEGAWEGDLDAFEIELVLKILAGLPKAVPWDEVHWQKMS